MDCFFNLQLLPATFTMSIVSTIDTPMFIFGTFALLFYAKGFLRKIIFLCRRIIFRNCSAVQGFCNLAWHRDVILHHYFSEKIRYLKNFHLWISFIFSALIYSPFLIWNYSHDFPFFVTATNLLSRKSSVESFIMFWISQILYSSHHFHSLLSCFEDKTEKSF